MSSIADEIRARRSTPTKHTPMRKRRRSPAPVTVETVLSVTSEVLGVNPDRRVYPSRETNAVAARYAAVACLWALGHPMSCIAHAIGYADHTTLVHALDEVESGWAHYRDTAQTVWDRINTHTNGTGKTASNP